MSVVTKTLPGIGIARIIEEAGYGLCEVLGRPIRRYMPEYGEAVGALNPPQPMKKGRWLFKAKIPRDFVGYFSFYGKSHWDAYVYGQGYLEEMEKLAKAVQRQYNVDITVHLVDSWPRPEAIWENGI